MKRKSENLLVKRCVSFRFIHAKDLKSRWVDGWNSEHVILPIFYSLPSMPNSYNIYLLQCICTYLDIFLVCIFDLPLSYLRFWSRVNEIETNLNFLHAHTYTSLKLELLRS
jgi:hypothetical protein